MDTKHQQQLYEYHVTSLRGDDITYEGFTLKQEKEYEDDSWTIWHSVYKNKKYVTMLDHNPREFIDEKAFKKYVEFFKSRGRWPDRQDFGGTYGTNEKVMQLTEGVDRLTFRQFLVEEELYKLATPTGYQLKKAGKAEVTISGNTKRVNEYTVKKDRKTIGHVIPHAGSKVRRRKGKDIIDFKKPEIKWGYVFDRRFQPTGRIPADERRGFASAKEALKQMAYRYEHSQASQDRKSVV